MHGRGGGKGYLLMGFSFHNVQLKNCLSCASTTKASFTVRFFCLGLVTLNEMKAKREDLVREHEKKLAAQLKQNEKDK